ncbi:uncharacterized protein [Panulirus ornatus]|uniref:uncharacterized protein isoform X2 n=1 Tax=Panulirus ornatus TaxID=150431 RepID=UPI003A8962EC
MRSSTLASHNLWLQILFIVVICVFLDLWVSIVAEPVGRLRTDNPVTSFPGKATWGYSSDVSGPISISGGATEGVARSFDTSSGATIRGGTTYGTTLGRWIGKATPIVRTASTKVVSSAVSVVDEEPGSGIDVPYETTTRTPSSPLPPTRQPPPLPPTRQPPPLPPTRQPPPLPPTRFVPFDFRRRRIYPFLPYTPFYFPQLDPYFRGGGVQGNVGPLTLVYGRLQSDPAYVHPQSSSIKASKLTSDEEVKPLGHNESQGELLSESLPLENGQQLQKLGSDDNVPVAVREQHLTEDNDSVSQELAGVSGRNLNLDEYLLSDGIASSNDLYLSDEFNSTDKMDAVDMTLSSEQVHSVHERNVENEYIFFNQTASYTGDGTPEEFDPYQAASLTQTGVAEGARHDQMVMASIFLKPALGGSILPYFEEEDMSSSPSHQSASPGNFVDLLTTGYGSNPTRTRQPIPRYIIVKDQNLGRVTVLGSDHEASSGGSGTSPSGSESSTSTVLETIDTKGENVTEGDRKEFESPSACIREGGTSRGVALQSPFNLGDPLAILLVMLCLRYLLPE